MPVSSTAQTTTLTADGYAQALALLAACITRDGLVASPRETTNYRRIWGRDGVVMGIAALLTNRHELIEAFRTTLETLATHQGPHGEIPSNVDTETGRVSYGGTTGRVDADLWFIIGCGEYWAATGDDEFLRGMVPAIEKVRFLLGAWEFNDRGLLYVPQTGDWADEYIHNGYVLYDQLLYLQAQRTLCAMHERLHGSSDHSLKDKASRLRHLIAANYWFSDGDGMPDDVYHEVLYAKGREAAGCRCAGKYWMPFFSPFGYGYRFDTMANVLVSLFDVADDGQTELVDQYIADHVAPREFALLPAFMPVITPVDKDWEELQTTFTYTFKNKPYEYHNGGLWQMVTGFYVASLARRGQQAKAERYLNGIHRANALEMGGERWSFPEFVHGQRFTPGGSRELGWNAAGAIIGQHALEGAPVFRIDDHA
jgi:glycogen debranching enzyme